MLTCTWMTVFLLCNEKLYAQESTDAGNSGAEVQAEEVIHQCPHEQDTEEVHDLASLKRRIQQLEDTLQEKSLVDATEKEEEKRIEYKVKELSQAIQFSGFFDVSVSTYKNHPNIFSLGSFEFDLKEEFNQYFQVGAALVFANNQADLAVGFIDLHLLGGLVPARGNIFLESGFHLQVGRFDIPIGNDWLYFASLDRPSISAPLTTAILMDGGYNDVGFRVFGNYKFLNYSGYLLQGAGNGVAAGGRIAIVPFSDPFSLKQDDAQPLDFGVSYLCDFSQGGHIEQETWVMDLEARYAFLQLAFEYYLRHDPFQEVNWHGFQGLLLANFFKEESTPFGIGIRADQVIQNLYNIPSRSRFTRGTFISYVRPFSVTVIKLEYSHYFKGEGERYGDGVFAQWVIGFK